MTKVGVLRKVEDNYPKRYLPLLAVTKLERDSTKVRICLDSKSKYKGISLNDYLLKGKLEMSDIFQLLTNFRCGSEVIQGDMKKMFWQIRLCDYDQQFHGIIYNKNTFVFTRVCYGDKPSPPIADSCMNNISMYGKKDFPLGSAVVEKRRFVDDLVDSGVDTMKMIQKRVQG